MVTSEYTVKNIQDVSVVVKTTESVLKVVICLQNVLCNGNYPDKYHGCQIFKKLTTILKNIHFA